MTLLAFAPFVKGVFSGVGLCVILFVVLAWSVVSLARNSAKVHDALEQFQRRARKCENLVELNNLEAELKEFARKHCLVRAYGEHATRVYQFIQGKKEGLQKL